MIVIPGKYNLTTRPDSIHPLAIRIPTDFCEAGWFDNETERAFVPAKYKCRPAHINVCLYLFLAYCYEKGL